MYFSDCSVELDELTFFRKNVNKQLKSADFFSELSKYEKKLLQKILSFFTVTSKNNLIFIVYLHNVKYLITPITQQIYVVLQKCKQITIFFRQICISQFVVSICLNLHFF